MRDLRNDSLLLHCLPRLVASSMCQDEVHDAWNPLSRKRKSEAILTQIRRQSDVQLAGTPNGHRVTLVAFTVVLAIMCGAGQGMGRSMLFGMRMFSSHIR